MSDVLEDTNLELILLDDFDEELECASDHCDNKAEFSMRHIECGQGYLFCKQCVDREMHNFMMYLSLFGYEVTCMICLGKMKSPTELEIEPL